MEAPSLDGLLSIARIQLHVGMASASLSHQAPTEYTMRIQTLELMVYENGFEYHDGYGQIAGMKLKKIASESTCAI